jgi:hypothetical protein
MCRKVNLNYSCGCKTESIRHCLNGAVLQFSCTDTELSKIAAHETAYECDRWCTKATERARAKLELASKDFGLAQQSREPETLRLKREAMDSSYVALESELAKHAACAKAREHDRDY